MKTLKFLTALVFSTASFPVALHAETLSNISDDPVKIKQFLAAPTTHRFPDSQVEWVWSREYLRIGQKIDHGCSFANAPHTPITTSQNLIEEEVAVDRVNCVSLIREGEPNQSSWSKLVNSIKSLTGRTIDSKKNSVSVKSTSITTTSSTTADAEDTYTYAVNFTDGNNPLMQLLGSNGISVATQAVTVQYQYNAETPVQNSCLSQISQFSEESNPAQPGISLLGWKVASGGSCEIANQYIGFWYPVLNESFDANGQYSDNGLVQLCSDKIPDGSDCSLVNETIAQPFSTIGSASQAVYTNNSSFPPFFDCSGGLTITVDFAEAYMYPRSNFHDNSNFHVVGTDGSIFKCVSNVKEFITRSSSIGAAP